MSLPRLSVLIELTDATLRLQIGHGRVSVAELQKLSELLKYYAATAAEMERRLDGGIPTPIPEDGNVVLFRPANRNSLHPRKD